jgi:uncharacterized protein DUF4129
VELGFLERNRLLLFSLALILLAFALGSLPRSQPGGPSILLNSYWLIYLLSLAPLVTLGLMVVTIAFLAYNWRFLSDAIGFGIANKRRQQKKKGGRGSQLIVWITAWAIALGVLLQKCGGICNSSKPAGFQSPVQQFVTGPGPGTVVPYIQVVSHISSFVQASWFSMAFLGFLIVSSVIIARGVKVYWDETRRIFSIIPALEAEGKSAVEDAIHILESHEILDPRTRIIDCYQRMVQAAQHLGAPITSDQTARELETAMRKMLILRGPAIGDLTTLFEEARYSLHPITDIDAEEAHRCLLDIAEEMKLPVSV